ncbi:MAG: phage tail protein [Clostridia bacterium]|nr:phage tail protein [Clostridia bacterium]
MATKFYGARAIKQEETVATPSVATSGITIAFGTAPVHQVDGKANTVVSASTYDEAVSAVGYSDDWAKYTLCEVIYSHFKLYGVGPLLLVNVLNPEEHKKAVAAQSYNINNGQVMLSGDAIADTITVSNDTTTYIAGQDYDVFYNAGNCIVEVLAGGAIEADELTSVTIAYSEVDFELDDLVEDLIGGYDVTTGTSTGLELMDAAYYKNRILPGIMIAPGFSHLPEVAAVMAAKTEFSSVFAATCICDTDTEQAKNYLDAVKLKESEAAFQNPRQITCWPMLQQGERIFHMSTQLAGLQCTVDIKNENIPSRVASNNTLQADGAVLTDGTEVLLDLTQANYMRYNGMCTAYSFVNGITAWGTYYACYPKEENPKEALINIGRMFDYIANTAILTVWNQVDKPLTSRLMESIVDELNMWLNNLTSSGDLYGARCAMNEEENPAEDLMAGIVRIHIYMAPPSLTQEVDFLLEYDATYVDTALSVG